LVTTAIERRRLINDDQEMHLRNGSFYYLVNLFRVSLSKGGSKADREAEATNDPSANCYCRFRSGLPVLRSLGRGNRIVGVRR
jgi:hypothetical protein